MSFFHTHFSDSNLNPTDPSQQLLLPLLPVDRPIAISNESQNDSERIVEPLLHTNESQNDSFGVQPLSNVLDSLPHTVNAANRSHPQTFHKLKNLCSAKSLERLSSQTTMVPNSMSYSKNLSSTTDTMPVHLTNKQMMLRERILTEKLKSQRDRLFPYDYSSPSDVNRANNMYIKTMNHIEDLLLKLAYIHGSEYFLFVNNVNHAAKFFRSDEIPCSRTCTSSCPTCPEAPDFTELINKAQSYLLDCCRTHSTRSNIKKKNTKERKVDLSNRNLDIEVGVDQAFSRFKQVRMVCLRLLESDANWGQYLPKKEPAKGPKSNLEDKFKLLFINRLPDSPSVTEMWEKIKSISPSTRKGVSVNDYEHLLISLVILAEAVDEPFNLQIDAKNNTAMLDKPDECVSPPADHSTNLIMSQVEMGSSSPVIVSNRNAYTEEVEPSSNVIAQTSVTSISEQELREQSPVAELTSNDEVIDIDVPIEQNGNKLCELRETLNEEKSNAEEYEVEKILLKSSKGGVVKYKVRWAGYGEEDDSWVLAKDFACEELIKTFNEQEESLPSRPKRKKNKGTRTTEIKNKKKRQ